MFKKIRQKIEQITGRKENMSKIFEDVYKKNWWQKGSGPGSFPENTVEYRKFLQNFLKKNNIKGVLDAGCGDWQFSKLINWDGIKYIGIDVVPFIIKYNIKNYSRKNIKFYKKDFLKDKLPSSELIIIKDVLQHLTTENIINFLPKLKNFKFALLINDHAEGNTDCENGHFRPLNLKKPPFSLKAKRVFFFNKKQVLLVKN